VIAMTDRDSVEPILGWSRREFEAVWKEFKESRRGQRIPQYKYVAKFFFYGGLLAGFKLFKGDKEEKR